MGGVLFGELLAGKQRFVLLDVFQAGAGVNAPPSSYTIEGRQYIVVAAGGNTQLNYKRGNDIIAFTLAE